MYKERFKKLSLITENIINEEDDIPQIQTEPVDIKTSLNNNEEQPSINDDDEKEISNETDENYGEIDITQLVNKLENIENIINSVSSNNDETSDILQSIFETLNDIENKLGQFNQLSNKFDDFGRILNRVIPATPEQQLAMRRFHSGAFSETPQSAIQQIYNKNQEAEKEKNNDYVITQNDVVNYNKEQIKSSFY